MSNSVLNRAFAVVALEMNGIGGEPLDFRVEGDVISVIAPDYRKFVVAVGLVRGFVEAKAEAKAKEEAEEKAKAEAEAAVIVGDGDGAATQETAVVADTATAGDVGRQSSPDVVVGAAKKKGKK